MTNFILNKNHLVPKIIRKQKLRKETENKKKKRNSPYVLDWAQVHRTWPSPACDRRPLTSRHRRPVRAERDAAAQMATRAMLQVALERLQGLPARPWTNPSPRTPPPRPSRLHLDLPDDTVAMLHLATVATTPRHALYLLSRSSAGVDCFDYAAGSSRELATTPDRRFVFFLGTPELHRLDSPSLQLLSPPTAILVPLR